MTAPVLNERTHRDVLVPLIAAGRVDGAGNPPVYDFGGVPGLDGNPGGAPPIHWLFALERRYVDPQKAGRASRSGWRLQVVSVGTTADEARYAKQALAEALEGRTLTFGGWVSTPVAHESSDGIELDKDGWWSGRTTFTYAL